MIGSIAIVGNGPTASGKGAEIDACDFVVRLKAFWQFGALDAGAKINAVAWYGTKQFTDNTPDLDGVEHWITQEPGLYSLECEGQTGVERLHRVAETVRMRPMRIVPKSVWLHSAEVIGAAPTTGFTAINMALHIFTPHTLHLFGFDGTLPEQGNYRDARRDIPLEERQHDLYAEKRVIASLYSGVWLGKPCETSLIWHDEPDIIKRYAEWWKGER